jgi:DNA-binding FrmR family transcriptional regulator
MAHISHQKQKLLARVKKIRGQLSGVEKAITEDRDCGGVLLTLASCRGAMNALMAEIMEGHVRFHLLPQDRKPTPDMLDAADELIDVIRRYLK